MPLIGFKCPPSAPTAGESHTFEHCITACADRCMSPYLLAAMASSGSKNHHVGLYISATSLSGCVRKLFLERLGPGHYEDPSKVFYGFRGTIAHSVVEEAADWKMASGKALTDLGYLSEWRMAVGFCFDHGAFPFPEDADPSDPTTWTEVKCAHGEACEYFVLGGTLDGAEPVRFSKSTGTLYMVLHDLKTMQEYAVDKFVYGDNSATLHTHTKDAYVIQANIYRYLAEHSEPPAYLREKGVKRIKFTHARLQAFAMGRAPYMGTHFWSRRHYSEPYNAEFIPPIEFFDDAWVENFVRTHGRPIYDTMLNREYRPPVCAPEGKKGHSWQCNFCAFHRSEYCPNPSAEWKALEKGQDREAAFQAALKKRLPVLP